jgi:hypothetical protein
MNGSLKRISDISYMVNSQSDNGSYNVNANVLSWNCSCPDHLYRGVKFFYATTIIVVEL